MDTNVTDLLKIYNFKEGYFYNTKEQLIQTVMITNDPNTNLIEAMKEKLPLKGKLADMLMDTLYIGKEAVYRRLRGEVPFTLQEAALVSRKLGK